MLRTNVAMAIHPVVRRRIVAVTGMSKLAANERLIEEVFDLGLSRESKYDTGMQAMAVASSGRRLKYELPRENLPNAETSMTKSQSHSESR